MFRCACLLVSLLAWPASAHADFVFVQQLGSGFTPPSVTIVAGDVVVWQWTSGSHTVTQGTDGTVDGNELFHAVLDSTHDTFEFWFSAAFVNANPMPGGVYEYFSQPDFPLMVGSITIAAGPGLPYCFGDGSGTNCPCGNASAPGAGAGCSNSLGSGSVLSASGTPSVANDTFVLQGSSMPNGTVLYFQGTAQGGGGAGIVFGDGLRCVTGTTTRLGTQANAGGASSYPAGGDPPVSVRGFCFPGQSRYYQAWYRNAAAFCTPATFNLTNGYRTVWQT